MKFRIGLIVQEAFILHVDITFDNNDFYPFTAVTQLKLGLPAY